MGNICSRSSNRPDDLFARPGRPLGSSNPPAPGNQTAAVPHTNKGRTNFASPGRTLGGEDAAGQAGSGPDTDVKAKAAVAAQKRAESQTTGKGKLGSKLAAQKAQTQNQTLGEVSREERAARDADGTAETRRWN